MNGRKKTELMIVSFSSTLIKRILIAHLAISRTKMEQKINVKYSRARNFKLFLHKQTKKKVFWIVIMYIKWIVQFYSIYYYVHNTNIKKTTTLKRSICRCLHWYCWIHYEKKKIYTPTAVMWRENLQFNNTYKVLILVFCFLSYIKSYIMIGRFNLLQIKHLARPKKWTKKLMAINRI